MTSEELSHVISIIDNELKETLKLLEGEYSKGLEKYPEARIQLDLDLMKGKIAITGFHNKICTKLINDREEQFKK